MLENSFDHSSPQFKELSKEEAFAQNESLMSLAMIAYAHLFKNTISKEHFQVFEANNSSVEMWDQLLHMSHCFVCMENQQIIGAAYLIPSGKPSKHFDEKWAYIRMLRVLPKAANKGVGRKLTMKCIQKAKDLKESTIALHTSEVQGAARHIYESLGFEITKEIEKIYGVRYWVYTKDLDNNEMR